MSRIGPAELVLSIALVAMVGFCAYGLSHCAPPTSRVVDCAARYQACVDESRTREQYEACRAGVDAACLPDAGGE